MPPFFYVLKEELKEVAGCERNTVTGILGIDLSLTGTGLALITPAPTPGIAACLQFSCQYYAPLNLYLGRIHAPAEMGAFPRWRRIAESILVWASFADMIVIEGYSYGSFAGTRACVEIGGIVRYHLLEAGKSPIEVAPTTLKKFILGKGVGEKSLMQMRILERYGCAIEDNNIADAFGLAKIGEAIDGDADGLPQFQAEVITMLKNGKPVKKARKISHESPAG